MHMRDVHPFCPRLSPLADCAFPSRQRTSDLTIARGRRFLCGHGGSSKGRRGHAWIGPRGSLAHGSQGWIAVQTLASRNRPRCPTLSVAIVTTSPGPTARRA